MSGVDVMTDALIELFGEEIPARMQENAARNFQKLLASALAEHDVAIGSINVFHSPRRLAAMVKGLPRNTKEKTEERRGPRVGAPDKALEGFLKSAGLARVEDLEIRATEKGDFYFASRLQQGRDMASLLPEIIDDLVAQFPWPVTMRSGEGDLRWVRPLHNIMVRVWDDDQELETPKGRHHVGYAKATKGHRVHAPGDVQIGHIDQYVDALRDAFVMIDHEERRQVISEGLKTLADAAHLQLVADEELLTEVVGLAEWPVVLLGNIANKFQQLPPEVLATSMRSHQKYFSLANQEGAITHFALVANIAPSDDGHEVRRGNERVLSARLADADYFYQSDLSTRLEEFTSKLGSVTFHAKLGNLADRVARVMAIADALASEVGAGHLEVRRAAELAKADLVTGMVGEFPELQGIMGAYYAKAQGEDDAVIDALRMQYKPAGPDDIVPTKAVAIALGLADRLDMLAGFWSIDEKPTGSKDPFALRRASLAILRILEANKLKISTQKLVREALAAQPNLRENDLDDLCADLVSFVRDRAKVMFRDRDIRHDVADALLAKDDFVFADVASNAPSLDRFLVHEGKGLVAPFKRARNILRQAEDYQNIHGFEGMEPAEERLKTSLNRAGQELEKSHDFTDKLTILSGLIAPMNDFFDSVVVNHEQIAIRARRLSLMAMVVELFDKVADFEALEG